MNSLSVLLLVTFDGLVLGKAPAKAGTLLVSSQRGVLAWMSLRRYPFGLNQMPSTMRSTIAAQSAAALGSKVR